MHWSQQYIGQLYVVGEADCARLVCQVRRDVFRADVPDGAEMERKASRLGRTGQLIDGVQMFGQRTESPTEGDAVLMVCRGRPSHVGVFCVVDGEDCVLHAMENAGMVVLHKLRDLSRVLLTIEGFYKWK